ncbi:MAG: methyltransferase domain-containing protein [Nanoarchaeota archaeon]
MRTIQRILYHPKSGKKFLVKDLEEDFHTQYGIISAKDIGSEKEMLFSNKKEKFLLFSPTFSDLWENLLRGPQVMIQKDIGLILAKTGINKDSRVVDAGGGSGSLCLSLANVCKEVTVYEVNPEHHTIISKNVNLLGFKNLTLKQQDVYKGIDEKELDLITLDLPEPWRVTKSAEKALKTGAFLIIYLPNLTQVQQFIESTHESRITVIETIELLERKWKIEEKILRPEFEMLGHTGFMVFCRKY